MKFNNLKNARAKGGTDPGEDATCGGVATMKIMRLYHVAGKSCTAIVWFVLHMKTYQLVASVCFSWPVLMCRFRFLRPKQASRTRYEGFSLSIQAQTQCIRQGPLAPLRSQGIRILLGS